MALREGYLKWKVIKEKQNRSRIDYYRIKTLSITIHQKKKKTIIPLMLKAD